MTFLLFRRVDRVPRGRSRPSGRTVPLRRSKRAPCPWSSPAATAESSDESRGGPRHPPVRGLPLLRCRAEWPAYCFVARQRALSEPVGRAAQQATRPRPAVNGSAVLVEYDRVVIGAVAVRERPAPRGPRGGRPGSGQHLPGRHAHGRHERNHRRACPQARITNVHAELRPPRTRPPSSPGSARTDRPRWSATVNNTLP